MAGAAGEAITVLLRPEPLSTTSLSTITCSVKVPAPTWTVSCGTSACEMPPCAPLIVRHGANCVPHAGPSAPDLSTNTVADADEANAAVASRAAGTASRTRERPRVSACKIDSPYEGLSRSAAVPPVPPGENPLRAFHALGEGGNRPYAPQAEHGGRGLSTQQQC